MTNIYKYRSIGDILSRAIGKNGISGKKRKQKSKDGYVLMHTRH